MELWNLNPQDSMWYKGSMVTLVAIVLLFLLPRFIGPDFDPREPPVIHSLLPHVGHIIGIFHSGTKYYETINFSKHPIYTLPVMGSRLYIVSSTRLAGLVQRGSKSLSFYSIAVEVTKRLLDFDSRTMQIIRHNLNSPGSLMSDSHDHLAESLSPGKTLDSLTEVQLSHFSSQLHPTANGSNVEINLMAWIKHVFTLSNAYTIYGPQNPFELHPELVQTFWDYEDGMVGLLADILPWITARKAYLARKKINSALISFVKDGRYQSSPRMIQRRIEINLGHGVSTEMVGHAELVLLFGILGNAVPTAFWTITNIYSRPALLEQLRREVESAVMEQGGHRVIKISRVKSCSPLLVSTFRETLRCYASLASVRWTLDDTFASDRYLLKKNSIVLIASGVTHKDPTIWGDDADKFIPDRFLDVQEKTALPFPKHVPSAAFRAFGGGSVICPGRHFALNEVMGFMASLILHFDILSEDGTTLVLPEKDDARLPLSVMKPLRDPRVLLRRRRGFENVHWKLEV